MKHAPTVVQQGHRYRCEDRDVLALASSAGTHALVAEIHEERLWPLGQGHMVEVNALSPLPMRYFAGQVPS